MFSAVANVSKATAIAATPFAAVWFYPKTPQVFSYTAKDAKAPAFSFPRPAIAQAMSA